VIYVPWACDFSLFGYTTSRVSSLRLVSTKIVLREKKGWGLVMSKPVSLSPSTVEKIHECSGSAASTFG